MPQSRDPTTVERARRSRAYRAQMMGYLAGSPVVQVKDLWAEAGLGADCYADHMDMKVHHAETLLDLRYRPVVVPAMSVAANVLVFVREPWPLDAHAGTITPRLLPYLEDGKPRCGSFACGEPRLPLARTAGFVLATSEKRHRTPVGCGGMMAPADVI